MSKKLGKRKKSSRVNDGRHIGRVVKKALSDLFILGDKYHLPLAINSNVLQFYLKGEEVVIGKKAMMEHLITVKSDWPLWVGLYFSKDGKEIEFFSSYQILEECTLVEFGETNQAIFDSIINKVAEDNNLKVEHLINYSYFVAPFDVYDMEAMEEKLIERFFQAGVTERRPDDAPVPLNYQTLIDCLVGTKMKILMPSKKNTGIVIDEKEEVSIWDV